MPTDSWSFPLEPQVFPAAAAIVAGENPALWPVPGGPMATVIAGGAGLAALAWGYASRAFVYIEDTANNYGGSEVGNLVPRVFSGRSLTLSGLLDGVYNVEVWLTRGAGGIATTLVGSSAGGSLTVVLPTVDRDMFLKIYPQGAPGAKVYDSASRTVPPGALGAADTGGPWSVGAPPAGLLFGLGTEMDGVIASQLYSAGPLGMITSWFNQTSDLNWMGGWKTTLIPQQYAMGKALHLIIYAQDSTISTISTSYGTAHGRAYPLSAQFQTDALALAQLWAGAANGPPLYVTIFTEFQSYAQTTNQWNAESNYWQAFKDAYTAAKAIFHANAPNARVSLGWGGWQARYDDPSVQGGLSMIAHFADVMNASDFQSFQLMQDDSNVQDMVDMTRILGAYGPVMVAHYKPNAASQPVYDADTTAFFDPTFMAARKADGLFAFSFMDQVNMTPAAYSRDLAAVRALGGAPTSNDYAVNGGELVLVGSSSGGIERAALLSTRWQEQDVHVKVQADKLPSGVPFTAYLMLRAQDLDQDYYRVAVGFSPGLAISIGIEKVLAGIVNTVTAAVTPGRDTFAAGTEFWIRAQATGVHPTTLRAKVWRAGTTEPGTWDVSGSDG